MKRLVLKRVTYNNFSSLNRNLRSHSAPCKCPLTILKCPLSVLWRCPSYREFGYSEMTDKRPGPAPGVRPIEVSVKRELTVSRFKPWMRSLHVFGKDTFLSQLYIWVERGTGYQRSSLLWVKSNKAENRSEVFLRSTDACS